MRAEPTVAQMKFREAARLLRLGDLVSGRDRTVGKLWTVLESCGKNYIYINKQINI